MYYVHKELVRQRITLAHCVFSPICARSKDGGIKSFFKSFLLRDEIIRQLMCTRINQHASKCYQIRM